MTSLIQIAKEFIQALQNRNSYEQVIQFYHNDVEQIEFPNALTKTKTIRNLNDLKNALENGKKVLLKEEYEIINAYCYGYTVIIESFWTGTLAIPVGNISVGEKMNAHFAQFLEFKDGKIIKQRNYDCFEPFS